MGEDLKTEAPHWDWMKVTATMRCSRCDNLMPIDGGIENPVGVCIECQEEQLFRYSTDIG